VGWWPTPGKKIFPPKKKKSPGKKPAPFFWEKGGPQKKSFVGEGTAATVDGIQHRHHQLRYLKPEWKRKGRPRTSLRRLPRRLGYAESRPLRRRLGGRCGNKHRHPRQALPTAVLWIRAAHPLRWIQAGPGDSRCALRPRPAPDYLREAAGGRPNPATAIPDGKRGNWMWPCPPHIPSKKRDKKKKKQKKHPKKRKKIKTPPPPLAGVHGVNNAITGGRRTIGRVMFYGTPVRRWPPNGPPPWSPTSPQPSPGVPKVGGEASILCWRAGRCGRCLLVDPATTRRAATNPPWGAPPAPPPPPPFLQTQRSGGGESAVIGRCFGAEDVSIQSIRCSSRRRRARAENHSLVNHP